MNAVQRAKLANMSSAAAAAPQSATKAKKAGAEFEAVLLNNVLSGLERAFTNLPGKKEDHSTDAYSGFAMEALATGLAKDGGIGIGHLIANALAKPVEKSAEK